MYSGADRTVTSAAHAGTNHTTIFSVGMRWICAQDGAVVGVHQVTKLVKWYFSLRIALADYGAGAVLVMGMALRW